MTLRRLAEHEAFDTTQRAAVSMGRPRDEATVEGWRARIARGTVWGLERDGVVAGHCVLEPTRHWFGGRPVQCLDVAAVAVAPEHRGKGVAGEMMAAAVERGLGDGYGLSLLFPATTAMYRKLDWELAGTRVRYRVPPRAVPTTGPTMRAADQDADWEGIRSCHEESVRHLPGPAVRDSARWTRLSEAPNRYVLDAPDGRRGVEAYALVSQRSEPNDWRHAVVLEDWAATTLRGLTAVCGLVGRWSTMARTAEFVDTVPSRWSGLVPEQDIEVKGAMHWMARALDVRAAIAARGFPRGVDAAVALQVEGSGAPTGPWRLEVADGRGQLIETRDAEVRLTPRGVGPLFTGFRTPRELQLLGLLEGPAGALEALAAAFAGPPPILFDFF